LSLAAAGMLAACGSGAIPANSPSDSQEVPAPESSQLAASCGRTLYVPSQFASIASALAAAHSGDTVRVAAGTYYECLALVDAVTLIGEDVPLSQPPAVTLDGSNLCQQVIVGDASIVNGATVKGFRVLNSNGGGINLTGSNGVRLSRLSLNDTLGRGIFAVKATFVLEHSTFSGVRGAGSVVLHGSKAVLVDNDISGPVRGVIADAGHYLSDPNLAPSRAMLMRNKIHDNGIVGVYVEDKGSEVRGVGNVYDSNASGAVLVMGGGSYQGQEETITNSPTGYGVLVQGCDLRCVAPPCSSNVTLMMDRLSAVLNDSRVSGNSGGGIGAICGADVSVNQSIIANSVNGAVAIAHLDFGGGYVADAPSTITAHGTVFSGHQQWGAITYDSVLNLGSIQAPGMNSFLSNGIGSIANVSASPVLAQWNWFGTSDPTAIAATIGGDVAYVPFLTRPPR